VVSSIQIFQLKFCAVLQNIFVSECGNVVVSIPALYLGGSFSDLGQKISNHDCILCAVPHYLQVNAELVPDR